MRHFMQQIYNRQEHLTPEKEHVESFLRGNGDDEVWKELQKRKLTEEENSWMEGPITKLEMRHQLFQHMKPNSAPGMDGFTVSWVKEFWSDLEDICELAADLPKICQIDHGH